MKKVNLLLLFIIPCLVHAQVGIKAGLNFANVTNASSINSSHSSGFMVAVFLAPPAKGIISYNTEIGFSRQGYNYATNENTGKVTLDYIMLPQLMGINISKFFTLQLGFQTAFLLNAKADSTTSQSSSNPYSSVLDYYNKFDYGIAAGFEIHPVSGLVIGARYNLSLSDLYKSTPENSGGETPSFVPAVDVKNNVVQLFAGWRFIKNKKEKK